MPTKSQKKPTFEAAMAELEQLVADLETGKLSLEASLLAYQRGAELQAWCRGCLDDAQQRVSVLEEGMLKDFSGSAEGRDE